MFRFSLSKVPLSCPVFPSIQNAQSRKVATTVINVSRRADIPSPRGLIVKRLFLLAILTSLAPGKISTPQDFLKAIGRSSETKISIDSWDAFWRTSGWDMKNAGLSIQDRRSVVSRPCCSPPVHHTRTQVYSLVHGKVQAEPTDRTICPRGETQ